MFGASAGSTLSRRRLLRLSLGCALLLAGLPQGAAAWVPVVELKFDETSGTASSNTGSASGSATLSSGTPSRVSNIPISGGVRALDFGTTNGNFFADLSSAAVMDAVKNLKSLTITGWVNAAMDEHNYGGGRIVSWYQNSPAGGVDLAYRSGGQLGLGINQYNDDGGVTSSPGKISVDPGLSYNNWRFFAVTFDGTVTTDNVKFYFGTNNIPASLDQTVTYNRTAVGSNTAPSLTIGNVPSHHRGSYFYAPFHGLIDQIRIYGSTTNNSGVLDLDQIQSLQQASSLVNVAGVVHEQWNGIPGNSLSALTCDPRFPYNPSLTKLRTNFEKLASGDDNYGARLSGWVKAPATGSYTFWIVGDDNSELRVSTDANPENKRLVASVATYNSNDTSWGQFPSQRSEPITLQANQHYYVEALVKDGGGPDFVRVGWTLPSGAFERPIPQARVVTTPPDAVTFYPSAYPLYEPGTFAKKAEMGWHKEEGNDHFYIKTDETKALIAQNGIAVIPQRLHFGPTGNLGLRWFHDGERNFDYLSMGTGNEGTPQFDVLKVRRTPSGVDGVEFPMGLDFPAKEHGDEYSTWNENGSADETGAAFARMGTHLSSTTEENGGLSAGRVGFNHALVSTETDHEYTQEGSSVLAAHELQMTSSYTNGISGTPVVTTGAMSAYGTQFQTGQFLGGTSAEKAWYQTSETEGTSTESQKGEVSANRAEFNNTFVNTEIDHEYTLENESALEANEVRLTRTHTYPNTTPFVTSSAVQADRASFTLSVEEGATSTTEKAASMTAHQVEVIETYNSTEIEHEFTEVTRSQLDKGQLRVSRTHTQGAETHVAETIVDPDQIVTGTVVTKKWRIPSAFPDYVFKKDYDLKTIEEVEAFARKHHHLPHFPSAQTMAEKGVDLAEMNLSLLRTVEEMTLHMASLKKDMRRQQEELERLKKQVKPKHKGKAGVR